MAEPPNATRGGRPEGGRVEPGPALAGRGKQQIQNSGYRDNTAPDPLETHGVNGMGVLRFARHLLCKAQKNVKNRSPEPPRCLVNLN